MTPSITRFFREIGARRLLVYLALIALIIPIARYSPQITLLSRADLFVHDIVTTLGSKPSPPDPRITLVVYNADTLSLTKKHVPFDRTLLAKALRQIDAFHPKAIGIDILFDQPQPEDDPVLIEALRGIQTPTSIAYLPRQPTSVGTMEIEGSLEHDFLEQFLDRSKGPNTRRATVLSYRTVRNWLPSQPGSPPRMASSLAGTGADFTSYDGPIRFRRPRSGGAETFRTIPLERFLNAQSATAFRSDIEGRYVIIGGELPRTDAHLTPFSVANQPDIYGIEILGDKLSQLLDGFKYRSIPSWALWSFIVAAAAIGAVTCLAPAGIGAPIAVVTVIGLFFGLPLALASYGYNTQLYPATGSIIAWIFGWGLAAAIDRATSSEQRRFAQSALGKYLPVDIASAILKNPDLLKLTGERRNLFVIFTDLEGFTEFSEQLEPEVIAKYLNAYLSALSQVVLDHGGTIDKFVGDALIAFWGAPIARADDADRSIRTAIALLDAGEAFRKTVGADAPGFGRTRVGLHYGSSLVGNFGGQSRIQYTALGDPMNTASRLESANKILNTRLLVSGDVLAQSANNLLRRMGRITVRGRNSPLEVFDYEPGFPKDAKDRLDSAVLAFYAGDPSALQVIDRLLVEFPDDRALRNLADRLRFTGPEMAFSV